MNTDTAPRTAAECRAADLDSFDDVIMINGKTARSWETEARRFEAEARAAHQRSSDSFDRCDTDGYLSQWASDSMGLLHTARAKLAREHGMGTVQALFDLDGNVLSTHEVETRYGWAFLLDGEAQDRFGRFVSPSRARTDAARIRNNAKKGVQVGQVRVRGSMQHRGGSADLMSVRETFCPNVEALKAGEFEIVTTCITYDED